MKIKKPPANWIPPTGFCECGCGRKTTIADKPAPGVYTGFPKRFLPGHNGRNKPSPKRFAPPSDWVPPSGLCGCGCGMKTTIVTHSEPSKGLYIGFPERFLRGHGHRKHPLQKGPVFCACGCGEETKKYKSGFRRFIHGHQQRTRLGDKHPNWNGGRKISKKGYIERLIPKEQRHLYGGRRYVRENILVWEQTHKRRLPKGWEVHHKNGNKSDNRPSNLVALTKSEHQKLHWTEGKEYKRWKK